MLPQVDHIQGLKSVEHHIRYFGRFPVSQFNDSLGGVNLKCTQWVQFRSTQPKLYFPKIMEFSHYNEYGVVAIYLIQSNVDYLLYTNKK